jgi:hypothetical protein
MEENAEAAMIYQMTRGQVRTAGEHIIDIDHVALWQNIDRYKVKEPLLVFEAVNGVFHYFLNKDRPDAGN